MKTAVDIVLIIIRLYTAYFIIVSVFAFKKRSRTEKENRFQRFAALIPARNEEKCIGNIVESLRAQDYPPELLDVFVIPNNCTDDTRGAALRAGAGVIDVSDQVNSKGTALREAMARLMDCGYDAFIVFDADNEASQNFVSEMDKALSGNVRIAKSRIHAKNAGSGWVCACYEIHFCFANFFLNRARSALGLSARVIGTGFAVKTDLIREMGGFRSQTVTEDAELFARCSELGERIAYCHEAVTYDEEPMSFGVSMTQRYRWMSGIMQVTRLHFHGLLRGVFRRKTSKFCLDALMQMTFAFIQALIPFVLIANLFLSSGDAAGLTLSAAIWYFVTTANAVICIALNGRMHGQLLGGILMYPVFAASFILLQTASLFRDINEWKEIKHTGVKLGAADRSAAGV